jgi:hypothetical protein
MLSKAELKKCEKIVIQPDEFQTLVYQDLEKLTMLDGSKKM